MTAGKVKPYESSGQTGGLRRIVKYVQQVRDGIICRKKTSLEKYSWPDFNENLIENKVKKLSSFPASDLKTVEDFLDRQEKIFIKDTQFLQKFTSVFVSFLVVLIPDTQLRIILAALFWLFLYSLEYFIQKNSITSRSFFCIQLLKEAQIRRSKT
ncbi:hypothetical protein [Acaryochloris sp. IP29b_bin.137]|uniref:hypothetical protein n=1 Tax=Acaryochloris sp. IP29b_bin.137 TaxID=2969217 RepID=UPI00260D1801|nr:hypothetical protein [Acaryochloris sp. IP29b_bin.137]